MRGGCRLRRSTVSCRSESDRGRGSTHNAHALLCHNPGLEPAARTAHLEISTMTTVSRRLVMAALVLGWAQAVSAQTANEIIEKHLAAMGGRAALGKLTSRT